MRRAQAEHDLAIGLVARRATAVALFADFERQHPVRARRWLQAHGRDLERAAMAAEHALLAGTIPQEATR